MTTEVWYFLIAAAVVVVGLAIWKGAGLRMRKGGGEIEIEVKERTTPSHPRPHISVGSGAEFKDTTVKDVAGVVVEGNAESSIPSADIEVLPDAKLEGVKAGDIVGVRLGAKTGPDARGQPLTRPQPGRVRILFLAANPLATSRLDLEEELRALELELRAVRYRDDVTLLAKHAIRPDDLLRHVSEYRPTVIHFSGHGSPEGIVLRSDDDSYQTVSGASLKRVLRDRGVELLVLNACYSRDQVDAIGDTVPTIVGTTSAVDDEAALRFTIAFYRSLGAGLTIGEAFRDAGDSLALQGFADVFHSSGELDRPLVG